jgi:uncharacterized protein (TIGR03086 family)
MAMLDLEPAATELTGLLGAVTDDQLGSPTPCENTSVGALLDHLMSLSRAFTWAAQKSGPDGAPGGGSPPGPPSADHLDPDWRRKLPQQLDQLVQAWRAESAWEGMTQAGGVTMPAEQIAVVAVDELVLHGWDLARATGQRFKADPASTAAVLAFTTEMAKPEHAPHRKGLFGPVVETPKDASDLDRALGLAGRDAGWKS